MVLSGLLEFILGNTYSFVAFTGFGLCPFIQNPCQPYRAISLTIKTGGFWLSTAISLTPSANATGAFTTSASSTVGTEYYASYGEFLSWSRSEYFETYLFCLMQHSFWCAWPVLALCF